MKITIITSNKNRHNYFINEISKVAKQLFVIQECRDLILSNPKNKSLNTKSIKYFKKVENAEKKILGINFCSPYCKKFKLLSLSFGDLNRRNLTEIKDFLTSDLYIIFGSSFIKGPLLNFLVKKKAINIHMGISPFYRGADCNYWAMKDKNFHLVGSTIHFINKKLDGGDILFYVKPKKQHDPFLFSMSTVKETVSTIVKIIKNKKIKKFKSFKQDKKKVIRLTKKSDFLKENLDFFKKIRVN